MDMMKVYRTKEKTQSYIDFLRRFENEYSGNGKNNWAFEMLLCGNGLAVIEVYDEDSVLVGYL